MQKTPLIKIESLDNIIDRLEKMVLYIEEVEQKSE